VKSVYFIKSAKAVGAQAVLRFRPSRANVISAISALKKIVKIKSFQSFPALKFFHKKIM